MGGWGSGRCPRACSKSRTRRLTSELIRIQSFTAMNAALERANKWSVFNLQTVPPQALSLVVSPSHLFMVSKPHPSAPSSISWIPMRKERCGIINGFRFTFTCPVCTGRCIYLYWDSARLACKHCHNLMHPVQSMGNDNKWFWRVEKVWQQQKASQQDVQYGERPKGMHRSTWNRLLALEDNMNQLGLLVCSSSSYYPMAAKRVRQMTTTHQVNFHNLRLN